MEDLYKLQTKEGVQRQFKDLTEEEISQLENGDTLKPLYEKCIHIIANHDKSGRNELSILHNKEHKHTKLSGKNSKRRKRPLYFGMPTCLRGVQEVRTISENNKERCENSKSHLSF